MLKKTHYFRTLLWKKAEAEPVGKDLPIFEEILYNLYTSDQRPGGNSAGEKK